MIIGILKFRKHILICIVKTRTILMELLQEIFMYQKNFKMQANI